MIPGRVRSGGKHVNAKLSVERETNLALRCGSKHQQLTLNTAVGLLFLQAASVVRQPAEGEAQVSKLVFELRRCVMTFLARYTGYTAQAEWAE